MQGSDESLRDETVVESRLKQLHSLFLKTEGLIVQNLSDMQPAEALPLGLGLALPEKKSYC